MTETTIPTQKGGTTVSHFSVSCPCGSGHVVEASDAGFSATTITVVACPSCASSMGAISFEMVKSWGLSHAVSASALSHRDGLVVFA